MAEARPLAADVAHASHGSLLDLIVAVARHATAANHTRLPDGHIAVGTGPEGAGAGGAAARLGLLPVPERLDAAAIRRWCATGLDALRRHQDEIDDLNVFPVPDGDTGTNLVLTMAAAVEALDAEAQSVPVESVPVESVPVESVPVEAVPAQSPGAEAPLGQPAGVGVLLARLARGALLGARGNSGIILAQFLRGLADALTDRGRGADGTPWPRPSTGRRPLRTRRWPCRSRAPSSPWPPGRGRRGREATSPRRPWTAARAARAPWAALARTPEQLPDLARAGVVDAGGCGLAVLLDALVEASGGRSGRRRPPHPGDARSQ